MKTILDSHNWQQKHAELCREIRHFALVKGDFTLSGGGKSDFYLDIRMCSLSSLGLRLISELILHKIACDYPNVQAIAGPTLGADPLVAGACLLSDLQGNSMRGGIVRKQIKSHGRQKIVEGPICPGDRVVVLEDVITSGQSARNAIEQLKAFGCNVIGLIAVVLRNHSAIEDLAREFEIKCTNLVTIEQLTCN